MGMLGGEGGCGEDAEARDAAHRALEEEEESSRGSVEWGGAQASGGGEAGWRGGMWRRGWVERGGECGTSSGGGCGTRASSKEEKRREVG
ncbi:hypothetical protein K525DRAFT_275374 [Schizophyllum commune Loenen D]|nr:hypothetical protein K525DRAFT_275374 [Schizophyllum commune Loenen D]